MAWTAAQVGVGKLEQSENLRTVSSDFNRPNAPMLPPSCINQESDLKSKNAPAVSSVAKDV